MTAESDIMTRLLAFSGLTALVGTRIRFGRLDDGDANPAVAVTWTGDGERVSAMGTDTGDVFHRLTATSWGATYLEAHNVAEQVRLALQRYSGGSIQNVMVVGGPVDIEDETTRAFGAVMDFSIAYKE